MRGHSLRGEQSFGLDLAHLLVCRFPYAYSRRLRNRQGLELDHNIYVIVHPVS